MANLASLVDIVAPAARLTPAAMKSMTAKLANAGLLSGDSDLTFLDVATVLVALAASATPDEVVETARAYLAAPLTMAVYTENNTVTHLGVNERIAPDICTSPITALAEQMAKMATRAEAAPKSLRLDIHRSSHEPTGALFVTFDAGCLQLQYGQPSPLESDLFIPITIIPASVIADVTALFASIPLTHHALHHPMTSAALH
jgi:hypothetical protein